MGSTDGFLARRISTAANNLFLLSQISMFAAVAIVAATVGQFGNASVTVAVIALSVGLFVFSVVAFLLPASFLPHATMFAVGILDLAVVAVLRLQLIDQQPRVSVVVLIPVLWLAYTGGIPGVIVAIIGEYLVAVLPLWVFGTWPMTAAGWGKEVLFPAIIGLVGIAVFLAAGRLTRQNGRLVISDGKLLISDDKLLISDGKLLISDGKLQVSIESLLDADATALAVFQTVDTGILFYAPDGRIILANDAARALRRLGGAESITTMSPTPLVFGEDRVTPVANSDQAQARAARGELTYRRTSWIGTGSEQRAIIVSSRYVRRASGELIGTVIAMHDVTSLAEALRTKEEFLATVSHELRTPLTSIIGYLEIIEDSADLDAVGIAAEVAVIHRNSERLLQLISALLLQIRTPTEVVAERIDLSRIIDGCVGAVKRAATVADVFVDSQVLEPVSAVVDQAQLSLALENVLGNAIKFTPAGGHVSVSLARDGSDAVLRVADDGVGIPATERARIFDPFFRGVVARNRVSAGSGLGLSTAKTIITAHGGTIQAHAVDSGGTTIEIRLPVSA